jgi:hypothetical protein
MEFVKAEFKFDIHEQQGGKRDANRQAKDVHEGNKLVF